MATLSRADISAAMSLILRDRMVDQFRRDAVLLNLVEVQQGQNDTLSWNPKFTGRSAGGAYAEGADMSDSDFDAHKRAKATLNWAEYRDGAKVSGLAMAIADRGYAGADMMGGDLFDEELVDAIDKCALDVATHLYSGDATASPVQIAGAAAAVDSTAGTYAGLATATYPEWLATKNSAALASLSFDMIRTKLIRPVKDATGRNPDFITTTGTIFDQVKKLFDDQADVVNEVVVRGQMINIKKAAGAEAVMLDGVPIIEDRHCTSGNMYAFTADHLKLVQLPAKRPSRLGMQGIVDAIKALTGNDVSITDVEQALRQGAGGAVVPTIEWLAQTGDAYKAQVKVYLQAKWRTRNGHARLILS